MAPANCFNGAMEDNSGEFGMPAEKWVGPRPPALAQAEIVNLDHSRHLIGGLKSAPLEKPKRSDRFTITREELSRMEQVAWAVKNSKQNVGQSMLDWAETAIKTAKQVRGEP